MAMRAVNIGSQADKANPECLIPVPGASFGPAYLTILCLSGSLSAKDADLLCTPDSQLDTIAAPGTPPPLCEIVYLADAKSLSVQADYQLDGQFEGVRLSNVTWPALRDGAASSIRVAVSEKASGKAAWQCAQWGLQGRVTLVVVPATGIDGVRNDEISMIDFQRELFDWTRQVYFFGQRPLPSDFPATLNHVSALKDLPTPGSGSLFVIGIDRIIDVRLPPGALRVQAIWPEVRAAALPGLRTKSVATSLDLPCHWSASR